MILMVELQSKSLGAYIKFYMGFLSRNSFFLTSFFFFLPRDQRTGFTDPSGAFETQTTGSFIFPSRKGRFLRVCCSECKSVNPSYVARTRKRNPQQFCYFEKKFSFFEKNFLKDKEKGKKFQFEANGKSIDA